MTEIERTAVKSYFENTGKKVWQCTLCTKIIKGSPAHLKDHITSKHAKIARQIGIAYKARDRDRHKFNLEPISLK